MDVVRYGFSNLKKKGQLLMVFCREVACKPKTFRRLNFLWCKNSNATKINWPKSV